MGEGSACRSGVGLWGSCILAVAGQAELYACCGDCSTCFAVPSSTA